MRPGAALRVPTRVGSVVWGALQRFRLRLAGVQVGQSVRIFGSICVHRSAGSTIELGSRVVLNARMKSNTLDARGPTVLKTFRSGATIAIGDDTGLTSATVSAGSSIRIGSRVLIGAGVMITDSDHHPIISTSERPRRFAGLPSPSLDRPVVIGDDVFVGARSIILKGVTIGEGAVVGAGSVVTSDVPPGWLAAGNPCAPIREL